MPERIQRRRTKGYRLPPDAIYVGRPTQWGNPYAVAGSAPGRQDGTVFDLAVGIHVFTREDAVAAYRVYALECGSFWWQDLRGHDLACWCPLDQPCHADVLLELANA